MTMQQIIFAMFNFSNSKIFFSSSTLIAISVTKSHSAQKSENVTISKSLIQNFYCSVNLNSLIVYADDQTVKLLTCMFSLFHLSETFNEFNSVGKAGCVTVSWKFFSRFFFLKEYHRLSNNFPTIKFSKCN